MPIQTNSAYQLEADSTRIRVLATDPARDQAIILRMDRPMARPRCVPLSHLQNLLAMRELIPVQAAPLAEPDHLLSPQQQVCRDRMKRAVDPLIKLGVWSLAENFWPPLVAAAKAAKVSPNCLYAALTRYLQSGCIRNALAPRWNKCGRHSAASGDRKPGQQLTKQPGSYPLSIKDIDYLRRGAKEFYKGQTTWEEAHTATLEKYYCRAIEIVDGREVRRTLPPGERPSFWQFFRRGLEALGTSGKLKAKLGERGFELSGRGKPGSQAADALQPGLVAEIDWTITDLVAVRRRNRMSIGRLVVYAIVDRASGEILSIYLTMATGRFEEAARAILVCLEDKVDLCARHGVNIASDDWPVQHLFSVLLSDKGEVDSWKATPLATGLGLEIIHAPGKRPDAKGTIEALMKMINYLLLRKLRGATTGLRQRCTEDPRVTAAFDFDQVNTVLHAFAVRWNKRVRRFQPMTKGMVDAGVLPVPNKIWQWAEASGCLRTFDLQEARQQLFGWAEASVTERGFVLQKLRYLIPDLDPVSPDGIDAAEWLASARQRRWKVPLGVDPSTVSHVWLRYAPRGKAPKLIRCPLAAGQDGYEGLSWEEYRLVREKEKTGVKTYEETALRAAGGEFRAICRDVAHNAAALTDAQRAGQSKSAQTDGIARNRAAEQAERNGQAASPPVPGPVAKSTAYFDKAVWGPDYDEETLP